MRSAPEDNAPQHDGVAGAGPVRAVIAAALAHSAYKCALFVFPPEGVEVELWILGTFTFLGGLAFGALSRAPWWVWF